MLKRNLSALLVCVALFALLGGAAFIQKNSITVSKDTNTVQTAGTKEAVSEPISYTTTLDIETDSVQQTYDIDEQLQAELESGSYTLESPLTVLNPYGNSPLTAVVVFTTQQECAVKVTVEGKTDATDVSGSVDTLTTQHRVPVVGLYADSVNQVTITLVDKGGKTLKKSVVQIQTDALPDQLQDAVTVEQSNAVSAYGLLEVSGFGSKIPFAFDTKGEVRWYLTGTFDSFGYFPLSNDHFMITSGESKVQTAEKPYGQIMSEMDFLGRTYQMYYLESGAHHEIIEKTEGGNLLVLTSTVDNYVEDSVVEIDRETGEVVKELSFEKMFAQSELEDRIDWCHLNTVSYDEASDSLLLSPRNIYSVIKVNWSTDELEWILADPTVWKNTPYESYVLQAEGSVIWPYQQHASYYVYEDLDNNPDTIQVMMYDNHWNTQRKIATYDNSEYSYVSLYYINEEAKTVSLGKTFESVKSKITSNYRLNLDAGRLFSMGMTLAYPEENDKQQSMIYEYDFDTGAVLNQYSLKQDAYRAYEFVPNLNVASEAVVKQDSYKKGSLTAFSENNQSVGFPQKVLDWRNDEDEVFYMYMKQDLLYLHQADHNITAVELVGTKQSYLRDYTNSVGTEEYKKSKYCLTVALDGVAAGEYKIVVTYKGTRYDTGETITIE